MWDSRYILTQLQLGAGSGSFKSLRRVNKAFFRLDLSSSEFTDAAKLSLKLPKLEWSN
jgi:hypothetical protein